MTTFDAPRFHNEETARAWLENERWPNGPECPHCGTVDRAYAKSKPGVYRCGDKDCRMDFTIRTKSVMESSHIPLHLWLQAFHLLCSSKKGMSAHQLHRTIKVTYKSAWFMAHRIREAMREGGLTPLGGDGGIVEADETYFGKIETPRKRIKYKKQPWRSKGPRGPAEKRPILALVERGGRIRTFHVAVANKDNVTKIVRDNIAKETRLHTDESRLYTGSDEHFLTHETVKHSGREYVRDDVHTNTAEGYFSIFKRGMKGVYQHCGEKHLHRYLAEYDFRYNHREALGFDDGERTARAIKGAAGKRLTYQQPRKT
jgi:transposase-like protein